MRVSSGHLANRYSMRCGPLLEFRGLPAMKTLLVASLFTAWIIVLAAATPAVAQTPSLNITGNATTAALVTDSKGQALFCSTPVTQTTFSTEDVSVGVWFKFNNGHNGDVLVINWIHPSGAVDNQAIATLDYNGSGCYAWFLGIKGQRAASEPGTWQVRLLVNGTAAFTLAFEIQKAATPQPLLALTSVAPSSAQRATTTKITLGGLGFVSPSTTIRISPPGITISSVSVLSPTLLIANLTISPTAAAGNYSITAVSGDLTSNAVTFLIANSIPMSGAAVPGFESLDQIALGLMQKYAVPGVSLGITKGGKLILARGYGYADVASNSPVYPDSLFRLASVSKPLTATAADKLVELGKLSYSTKVFDILNTLTPLPGQQSDPRVKSITVEQLMNHRAGFPHDGDIASAARLLGLPLPGSLDGVIRYQIGRALDSVPGETYSYSNLGYDILALVVQAVSGKDYDRFVSEDVLGHIGLTHTHVGSHLKEGRFPGEVTYYVPGNTLSTPIYANLQSPVPVQYGGFTMDWPGSPAGAGAGAWVSNVIDMLRFEASVTLAVPPVMFSTPPRTGFGFSELPIGRGMGWRHDGGLPGTSTTLHISDDVAWCVLTNGQTQNIAGSFLDDFDQAIAAFVGAKTDWPPGDLFPQYLAQDYPFKIGDRGAASLASSGASSSIDKGYARIKPDAGSTTPAGLAVFGFRQNNVLVTEAGIPASTPILAGRIYAALNGPVNTGLAMANPNSETAYLSFYFSDSTGNSGAGTTAIPPGGQISAFLNQSPFNGPSSFSGSFSFTSTVPVAAIAIRGFTNDRNEFLITTLPVADLSTASSGSAVVFPHFADGGGWTTQIVLVNPGDDVLTGTVQFRDVSGLDALITVDNVMRATFPYSIPARSSQTLQTSGKNSLTVVGSARVVPANNSSAPSGVAIFSLKSGETTIAEAGVPAVPMGTAFRSYVETTGDFNRSAPGSVQTGIAVTNLSSNAATVKLELFRLDGSATGLTETMVVPGNGQTSTFLYQVPGFRSLPPTFQGVLRLSSATAISSVGLRARYNERQEFLMTTLPTVNEATVPSIAPAYFPHLADGGGYTTQFILFSAQAGLSSSGNIQMFSQNGTLLHLPLQ